LLQQSLLTEEAQRAAYEAECEELASQRDTVLAEVRQLNEDAVRIAELERQVAISEGKYRTAVEKMEQARIYEALDRERVSSINIVQPATLVEKPVSPNKRLSLAAGLFIALVGGACLALAVEYFDLGTARRDGAAGTPEPAPVSTSPGGA
jgi:uncharacterized protein involved in exopolysaccharide biosynthesis